MSRGICEGKVQLAGTVEVGMGVALGIGVERDNGREARRERKKIDVCIFRLLI